MAMRTLTLKVVCELPDFGGRCIEDVEGERYEEIEDAIRNMDGIVMVSLEAAE